MTREEQVDWLCRLKADLNNGVIFTPWNKEFTEALNKALEQESCEDVISRQTVLEQTYKWSKDEFLRVTNPFNYLRKRISSLPSVTVEQKTGHWITHIKSDRRGDYWPTNPKCSECDGEPYYSNSIFNYKFCPYCGAKMEERRLK